MTAYEKIHFLTEARPYFLGPSGKPTEHNFMIRLEELRIWYSFQHIVAFSVKDEKYVSENIWSRTTGKHINAIEPDHEKRIGYEEFVQKFLEIVLKREEPKCT